MSDSQVIARKFRPQTFDQMVGQEAIRRTLENSIKSGRLHHAYLFAGARGVGKTTTARILAKALNCAKGPTVEPCGVCASCTEIAASRSIDVMEIDAASYTGVDNVRDVIINTVQISPARDRYKIFIIDEVHMLSNAAFNALLKTLEEPPSGVVFIMATTVLHKVPETILSRCQVFEFRTITLKKIFDQLKAIAGQLEVEISDAALLSVARAGEGSMRDAQSALDQVISFAGRQVSGEDVSTALGLVDIETLNTTMRAISEQDAAKLLQMVDEIVGRGYDLRNFCRELMTHIRALLVTRVSGFDAELVQLPAGEGEALARLAESFSEQDLIRFFTILTKTEQDIRASSQPRFQLEIGLMKLLQTRRLRLLEEALEQLSAITSQLGGAGAGSGAPSRPSQSFASPAPSGGKDVSGKASAFSSLKATAESSPLQSALSQAKAPAPDARAGIGPGKVATPAASPSISFRQPAARVEAPSDPFPESDNPFASQNDNPFAVQPAKVPAKFAPPTSPTRPQSSPARGVAQSPDSPAKARGNSSSPPPWADEPPVWDGADDTEPLIDIPETGSAQNFAGRLKEKLQTNRKMMVLSYLNQAQSMVLDGDTLRVTYAQEHGRNKSLVDSSNNRKAIEEACKELSGRKITISVRVEGQSSIDTPGPEAKPQEQAQAKERAEDHPALRALTDKFQGQIIEIVKPED